MPFHTLKNLSNFLSYSSFPLVLPFPFRFLFQSYPHNFRLLKSSVLPCLKLSQLVSTFPTFFHHPFVLAFPMISIPPPCVSPMCLIVTDSIVLFFIQSLFSKHISKLSLSSSPFLLPSVHHFRLLSHNFYSYPRVARPLHITYTHIITLRAIASSQTCTTRHIFIAFFFFRF